MTTHDKDNIHCPVCGYYCLGNGGVGCIDKPALVKGNNVVETHDKYKVIATAKECGAYRYINRAAKDEPTHTFTVAQLERFYAIAFEAGRQAEREECAKVCEALGADYEGRFCEDDSLFLASSECAKAIRARGDTK